LGNSALVAGGLTNQVPSRQAMYETKNHLCSGGFLWWISLLMQCHR
jgi:hypothetical protein